MFVKQLQPLPPGGHAVATPFEPMMLQSLLQHGLVSEHA